MPKNIPQADPRANLHELIRELSELRANMLELEASVLERTPKIHELYLASARNLLHYAALRRHDARELQTQLTALGLSSLGRCEAHVLATIEAVLFALHRMAGRADDPRSQPARHPSFEQGPALLARHTDDLLGPEREDRRARIMVTLPSDAADDFKLVMRLLERGVECVRINCAHDDQAAWGRMLANLRRAEELTGKKARVLMDLAGPKLRTGPIEPGPRVLKIKPRRDAFGKVVQPARVWMSACEIPVAPTTAADATLTVPAAWLARLTVDDKLKFIDARGAARCWSVVAMGSGGAWLEADATSYCVTGSSLRLIRDGRHVDDACVGEIEALPGVLLLRRGESLLLTRELTPGRPAQRDTNGNVREPARIGCTLPEVFSDVCVGESLWLDDGRIGCVIRSVSAQHLELEVTHAGPRGERLRADKGINLPDSRLSLPALTAKDLADLEFVASHADMVALSFAHDAADVHLLEAHLARLGQSDLGIVLKIETRRAFEQLPSLLLASMCSPRDGVMIARGDLAVEVGWERLAEVQEEILWICEAAHIPVIWATQVLESLAKTGRPSRAEITDAAMSERAECVMLNKGPQIDAAVEVLDDILRRMQGHQRKKRAMLRPLRIAELFDG